MCFLRPSSNWQLWRNYERQNANYYLSGALIESKQHKTETFSFEKAHCSSNSPKETWKRWTQYVSASARGQLFYAKCLGLHWHVLVEGKLPIKFHKTFINCDVFTGNVCSCKLLLQACYKWANFGLPQSDRQDVNISPESWSSALGSFSWSFPLQKTCLNPSTLPAEEVHGFQW